MNAGRQRRIENTLCFERVDGVLQEVFKRLFHGENAKK